MMRSLWTAASGMIAQQTNLDTISNNLANVNTTGYKKETCEFKSLMYQTIQSKSTDNNGDAKPVGIQVGLGVRTGSIMTSFSQGGLNESEGDYDYAIQGNGFFMTEMEDGSIGYTRNGDFTMSVGDTGMMLTNSSGNSILGVDGKPIILPFGTDVQNVTLDEKGNVMVPGANGKLVKSGFQVGLAYFNNAAGLEKISDSTLKESVASGTAVVYSADKLGSKIKSGYLESSNVQTVDEMVNMIIAQRAYEMNSKAITASDEMLQQANNLRR